MLIFRRLPTSSSTRLARLRTNQRALGISSRSSNAHAASAPMTSASHRGRVMLVDMRLLG